MQFYAFRCTTIVVLGFEANIIASEKV